MVSSLRNLRDRGDFDGFPTVYIGGGTPSVLGTRRLRSLLETTAEIVTATGGEPTEWTLELNPEDVDEELIALLRDGPVTRVSLGGQSFDPELRRRIGRRGSARALLRAAELLAAGWTGSWSIDLISGIPRQSADQARADVRRAASFGPQHLSIYALSLEPGTALAEGGELSVDSAEAAAAWCEAAETAREVGYRRYEVSNFARTGYHCRHNSDFWEGKPYVGLGPSAVSTLWGEPPLRRHAPGWGAHQSDELQEEALSAWDLAVEYLMLRLRTVTGLDLDQFRRIFGSHLAEGISRAASSSESAGLLRFTPSAPIPGTQTRLAPTEEGFMFLDAVLRQLVSGLPKPAKQFDMRLSIDTTLSKW
jgi:oxygen-independent coproporphyrinogen-3 oxidase